MEIRIPFTQRKFNIPIPPLDRHNEAKRINEKAARDHKNAKHNVEEKRLETKECLESYGRLKLRTFETSMRRFVNQYERIHNVEVTPIQSNNAFAYKTLDVIELHFINFTKVDGFKTAIAGVGAGAASGAAVFGAVGVWGAASTGAAISTLSGAAATNATLAWLGGGSIASGGLGVAGGTLILGGLIAIPLFVVGGFILNAKSKEELNNAKANRSHINKFLHEVEAAISTMNIIINRTNQISVVVKKIEELFIKQLNDLEFIITKHSRLNIFLKVMKMFKKYTNKVLIKFKINIPEWLRYTEKVNYNKFSQVEKEKLWVTIGFAQTLKNILDTDLIDLKGVVTEVSEQVLNDANHLVENQKLLMA